MRVTLWIAVGAAVAVSCAGCGGHASAVQPKKSYNNVFEAADAGDQAGVFHFVRIGESSGLVDGQGKTALHHAAANGNEDIIRMLINDGANVNAQDGEGKTPLQEAQTAGKNKAVQVLKELGANG